MDSASTSAAALKEEIARLTGKSFLVVHERRVHISRFALFLAFVQPHSCFYLLRLLILVIYRSNQPSQEYRTATKILPLSTRPTAEQRLCEPKLQASK